MSNVARKLLPALLTGAMLALAACSGGGDTPAEPAPTGENGEPAALPEKPESISYWSMWNEGETQQKVIAEAVKAWEEETGIKVDVEWQGRGVVQKLTPALNTNKVPDLVDAAYNKIAPILVTTGQAGSLQGAYDTEVDGEKVSDLIPEKYLSDNTNLTLEDGTPWMLPYSISSEGVWFDAATHPDWSSNPPETWGDFVTVLDELKSSDQAPLAIDGDIGGYNSAWFSSLMIGEHGPGAVDELITSEDGSAWDAPEVVEIAKRVEDLASGGYFIPGYNASKFPAQQEAWGSGKAAMLFTGSWIPAETSTYVKDGFVYDSFPLPTDSEKKYARAEFVGYVSPTKAKNTEWASNLAASVLSLDVQNAYGTEAMSLPVRLDAEVSPELQSIVDHLAAADGVYAAFDGAIYPGYIDKVLFPINNDLVLGKISGEEFVSNMKDATVDYWKNQ